MKSSTSRFSQRLNCLETKLMFMKTKLVFMKTNFIVIMKTTLHGEDEENKHSKVKS